MLRRPTTDNECAPQYYIRRLRAGKPALKEKKNKSDAAVRKHLLYSKKASQIRQHR